jgi:hypothetical protein
LVHVPKTLGKTSTPFSWPSSHAVEASPLREAVVVCAPSGEFLPYVHRDFHIVNLRAMPKMGGGWTYGLS